MYYYLDPGVSVSVVVVRDLDCRMRSALAAPYQYERDLIHRLNEAAFGVQPDLTL